LASEGVELELIVIDQSDEGRRDETRLLLPDDGRLRYVPSRTRGLGAGLDEGLSLATWPVIVHTDDDCVVSPEWVLGMAMTLEDHPRAGLVFCNVVAAPYDPSEGYVPTYEVGRTRILRSVLATCLGRGLGAGMAFRQSAVREVGGVDAMMGAGSRFHSCEDWDIELRMLLSGWEVVHTPEVSVVHHGFRTFAEGRDHAMRDWFGIGACMAKLARAGHPSALVIAAWQLGVYGVLPPLGDVIRLRRPRGLQRVVSFCRGFAVGLVSPVDPARLRFALNENGFLAWR
jgi:hypothetical protein